MTPLKAFLAASFLFAALSGFAADSSRIETIAGTGTKGFSGDGQPARETQLSEPSGLARGPDGALYFCDTSNHRIRKITSEGKIITVAGNGSAAWSGDGGPATAAGLHEPWELRFDRDGNLYWVERLGHVVRRLDAKTGIISSFAGTGAAGFSGDGGPASQAQLNQPHSLAIAPNGDLFICDIKNNRIRRVDMKTGTISTFCGTGEKQPTPDGSPIAGTPLNGPRAIDFDAQGRLWLALREGNAVLVLDLAQNVIHHVAGTGKTGFTGNGGPAREATLSGPKGIAVAPDGTVFLADTESHSIRKIDPKTGVIDVVVGTGKAGDGPDGDPLHAQLNRPHGVLIDHDGSLLVGDTEAHRIRVVHFRP
jgi:streptogramin lyase